jgi:hypothetical protein
MTSVIFATSRRQSYCFSKSIPSCQYFVILILTHFGIIVLGNRPILLESAENPPKIRRIMSRRKSAEKKFGRPYPPKIRRKFRPAGRNCQKNSAEGSTQWGSGAKPLGRGQGTHSPKPRRIYKFRVNTIVPFMSVLSH